MQIQTSRPARPDFQAAIRQAALDMLSGEDVERRIGSLARFTRRDPTAIRHEIDEMADVLKG